MFKRVKQVTQKKKEKRKLVETDNEPSEQHINDCRHTVQRAPWNNHNATFETDNGLDKIPKSVYKVLDKTYLRYAPINTQRCPGQEFHEDERTFTYIPGGTLNGDTKNLQSATKLEKKDADKIEVTTNKGKVDSKLTPANGYTVWDALTDDSGNVLSSPHVGHPVENLGCDTPKLTDSKELRKLRERKKAINDAQKRKEIPTDSQISHIMYNSIDHYNATKNDGLPKIRDDAGMLLWEKVTELGKKVKSIQDMADRRTELQLRLEEIRKSPLYGFSDRYTTMEEKVLKMIKDLK